MFLAFLPFLVFAPGIFAQAGFTPVTAIVHDPNHSPYSSGTVQPTIISSATPTLNGVTFSNPGPTRINPDGSFNVSLPDNAIVLPAGSHWVFQVCGDSNLPPPIGVGSQCFTSPPLTITGSTTQDISINLNPFARLLTSICPFANSDNPTIVCAAGIPVEVVSTTPYIVKDSDRGKLKRYTNAGAGAWTLGTPTSPLRANSPFTDFWFFTAKNESASSLVITPTAATIDGSASLTLTTGQSAFIYSNNANYFSIVNGGGGGGSGCTPTGGDLAVQTNHPIGTCYGSPDFTWDDGASQQNLQAGLSNTITNASLSFLLGNIQNAGEIGSPLTSAFSVGQGNNLCDAGTEGAVGCEFLFTLGINNALSGGNQWIFGNQNTTSESAPAGSNAEPAGVWINGANNTLTFSGTGPNGTFLATTHIFGDQSQATANGYDAEVERLYFLGIANEASADGTGTSGTQITQTFEIVQVGQANSADSTALGTVDDIYTFGEANAMTAPGCVTQLIFTVGENNSAQCLAAAKVQNSFMFGNSNSLTANTSTRQYMFAFGNSLTLADCSDCFLFGENGSFSGSGFNNTIGIGLSATPEVEITSGALQFTFITGSTQCLQASTLGMITGTGTACGSGSGSGTVNSGTQFAFGTYNTAGTAISSGPTPPTTNGAYICGYQVATNTAVAPTCNLMGLLARSVSGATSTDTVLFSDNNEPVEYQGSVAVAVALPTPTTLQNTYFWTLLDNLTTGSSTALTITPAGGWTIAGGATFNIPQLFTCRVEVDPLVASNWLPFCGHNTTSAGGGSPGAPDTSVQFAASGAFAGDANFEWNNTTKFLTLGSATGGEINLGTYGPAEATLDPSVQGYDAPQQTLFTSSSDTNNTNVMIETSSTTNNTAGLTVATVLNLAADGVAILQGQLIDTYITGTHSVTAGTLTSLDIHYHNNGSGSLLIGNGIRIESPNGVMTNAVSLEIEDVSNATNNWAIQTGLGLVEFGGSVILDTATASLPVCTDASKILVTTGCQAPILTGTTGSIGGGLLTIGTCTSGTVSVTGATTGMNASASPVTYPGDGNYWLAYVSAADTVTVKVCAVATLTPSASVYNVRVIQ
jgi:hypothetical protein